MFVERKQAATGWGNSLGVLLYGDISAMQKKIRWYRSPVDGQLLRSLTEKSDLRGLVQAAGHLAAFIVSGLLCYAAYLDSSWVILGFLLLLHGIIASFMIAGIHELVHGTVFSSEFLNQTFLAIFSFIIWLNPHRFWASHTEHHSYTLHPPLDQEVVLPAGITLSRFLKEAFVYPPVLTKRIWQNICFCLGIVVNPWDKITLADSKKKRRAVRWARTMVPLHIGLLAFAIYSGHWMVPLLISATPAYGGILVFLCGQPQHAGMKDNTADFRLSTRTMRLNPALTFLYWHMNYHVEHHMYPMVPCYNLARLHKAIEHDLPPTLVGLIPVWREIIHAERQLTTSGKTD
jgi:fatty acid desaturase